jgi:hypothetical protein
MPKPDGATLLAKHIKAKYDSQREFAGEWDFEEPMVSRLLSRKMRPSLAMATKIESATDGEVPATSWMRVTVSP